MLETKENTVKSAENIDEQGNVLYLDKERLDRKPVGFAPYKNKSNGLGIYNWLAENVTYLDKKRMVVAPTLYRLFIKYSAWLKKGKIRSRLYKMVTKLYPDKEKPTSSIIMPLNVDVTDKGEKVAIPKDLIKEALKRATFIAGMDECLCRVSNNCKNFDHGLGCLFLGEAARTVVKHGLAREFTYEEGMERVDEAERLGLMSQAVWIEVEQMIWGVRNDLMDQFLEICFCCPCCCIATKLVRNIPIDEKYRFHPSGWTAVADRTKCVGCKKCGDPKEGCPLEAITFDANGKVEINQELCVGCGLCVGRCAFDSISIKQTMPMRKNLEEYFLKDYNIPLKVWVDDKPENN